MSKIIILRTSKICLRKLEGKITKIIRQMLSSEAFFTIKHSRGRKEVHKLPHNLEEISNFKAPIGRHEVFPC